jgi:hypothetical protein
MNSMVRIGIAITAAAAMLAVAGSAVAQSRGDVARGEALNKRYQLGAYSPSAQAGPKPAALTTQQWEAELARGAALNERYVAGVSEGSRNAQAIAAPTAVAATASGFDWGSAGIGAGAAIGLSLLGIGTAVVVRQTRRSQLSTAG